MTTRKPSPEEIARALASARADIKAYEDEQAGIEYEEALEPEELEGILDDVEMPAWDEEKPKGNGKDRSNGQWYEEEPGDRPELQPFKTICASSWHKQPVPEIEFLDDRRLIPIGYASILTGASGIGKTYLALQAAIACAAGLPWLGAPIRKGPVLFYSAEEDIKVLHMRTAKICFAENIHLNTLADLHFIDLSEIIDAALIKGDNRSESAKVTALYNKLDLTMGLIRPVSAWADNKGLIITGNENSRTITATAMRALQLLAGKHVCALTMLQHPSNTGMNSGTGASGSTAGFAGVRSVLNLTKPEDADEGVRVLDNSKTNYSKSGTQVNLKWDFDRYVCTDPPKRVGDEIGKIGRAERVFLTLLRWHAKNNLEVSPASRSPCYAPVVFEAHKGREGLNRKWFKMAMDNLIERKLIEVRTRGKKAEPVRYLVEANYNPE